MRKRTHRVGAVFTVLAGFVLTAAGCTAPAPAPGAEAEPSASPSAARVTPDLIVEKIGCSNARQESSVIGVSVACNIGETYFGIFDFKAETETTISDMITYQGGGYARYESFLIMTSDAVVGKEAFAKLGVEGKFQEMPEEPSAPPTPEGPIQTKGKWQAVDSEGAEYTFTIGGDVAKGKAAKLINRIDGYRLDAGDKRPIYFLVVQVDNTHGTGTASADGMVLINTDGEQIESLELDDLLSEWRDTRDINEDSGLYNRGVDLSNDLLDLYYRPKAKGFDIIAFRDKAPEEVLAIYLNVESVPAYKAE